MRLLILSKDLDPVIRVDDCVLQNSAFELCKENVGLPGLLSFAMRANTQRIDKMEEQVRSWLGGLEKRLGILPFLWVDKMK